MKPLQGKVSLVTGASRGIGKAIAHKLAEAGSAVAINYRQNRADAEAVVREITSAGGQALAVQADVAQVSEVEQLVSTVESGLGPVDILVNNAGVLLRIPLPEVDLPIWRHTIETNLTSAFVLSQQIVPGMRQRRWGRLIYLSSIAAQTGGVVGPHYAASKAGMLGLMHSYASLLAKEGITSNAIAPALIETDMIQDMTGVKPDVIPVGRFGTADEIADAALLLATNSYITGQTLNLNGGWFMS